MPDVYAAITEVDAAALEQVAEAMEISAADPQQQAMVNAYLSDLSLPGRARALEIGCGTGAIARILAGRPGIGEVIGVDPSPLLIEKARTLGEAVANLSFAVGDGRDLEFEDASFDLVLMHRVLSHVASPEQVLAEASRVLRPGASLAVFDGDYATITVATTDVDPLQSCVQAFAPAYISDPWVVRRLPSMIRAAGFLEGRIRSFGYVQVDDPDYMLSIVARGADALATSGRIGEPLADALKAEASRRAEAHSFFGHIAYASLTARKPGSARSVKAVRAAEGSALPENADGNRSLDAR
jgi:ubiquinone/menaquinone biosynthesis C-methylase UbiE